MDLVQIRYFLALARTLNFTRAAEACNVTQPALTKSIQRLEHELGGPLLLRERSLTQLTELGRTTLPLLEQAYDAAGRAKEHAAGLKRQSASPLRVGFAPEVPSARFMPLFTELAARLAGLEVALQMGGNAELGEALLQGALDAAVVAGDTALPDRLNRWVLFADAAVAVMPPTHPLAALDVVPSAALTSASMIGRAPGSAAAGLLEQVSRRPGGGPAVRHRGDTSEQATDLARAGFGVALLMEGAPVPAGLVSRPLAERLAHDVLLAAVAGRPFTRAADAFIKLARARDWQAAPIPSASLYPSRSG